MGEWLGPEEGNHLRMSTQMPEGEAEERRAGWTGAIEEQPSGEEECRKRWLLGLHGPGRASRESIDGRSRVLGIKWWVDR